MKLLHEYKNTNNISDSNVIFYHLLTQHLQFSILTNNTNKQY